MAAASAQVKVSVDDKGQVQVAPETVVVSGPNALISFKLVTAGWSFDADNAIVVESGGSNFPYPSWTIKPDRAALFDADGSAGDFSYTISLVHSSGKRVSIDPTIRNEG